MNRNYLHIQIVSLMLDHSVVLAVSAIPKGHLRNRKRQLELTCRTTLALLDPLSRRNEQRSERAMQELSMQALSLPEND